jgi:molybdopterin/thiamine biosynthesis adenylyltransferase
MLTKNQVRRYGRQILIPEVGGKGQEKLLNSRVLIVGAGGLGSAVIEYLAAAGVGSLGIADGDTVDETNLHRQTIHAGNVGMNKAESAAEFVHKLNPDVEVNVYPYRVAADNVRELIRDYQIVVDCTDNFPARFLLNDACIIESRPLIHAAVLRFEGQIMTIKPGETACYRCFLPEAPPPGSVPSCSEAGVIGITTGFFGILQAGEVLKLILGKGDLFTNRLLYVDLLNNDFNIIEIKPQPTCPACGESKITELREEYYVETCRIQTG